MDWFIPEKPAPLKVECTCDVMTVLMTVGCQCGASEKEKQMRKQAEGRATR